MQLIFVYFKTTSESLRHLQDTETAYIEIIIKLNIKV